MQVLSSDLKLFSKIMHNKENIGATVGAKLLCTIGDIFNTLGKAAESLESYKQALEMRQALYESDHPDVASSSNNVGTAYRALGDAAKALQLYEQALESKQ